MSIATEKIEKQIKTIAVLYFAFAGFSFLMLMLLPLHYMMFRRFSTMGFPVPEGQPDPMEMMAPMMDVMIYFYIVMGVLGVLFVISTFLTGTVDVAEKKSDSLHHWGCHWLSISTSGNCTWDLGVTYFI